LAVPEWCCGAPAIADQPNQPSGAKNCSLRRQVVATGNELSFPANHDRTWLPPPVRPS
jgi:hypothetical protein